MITKLAEKWRKKHTYFADICADELEAALPTWTRITDDPDTRPEDGKFYVFTNASVAYVGGDKAIIIESAEFHIEQADSWYGFWYRPLIDIDYPPEQDNE